MALNLFENAGPKADSGSPGRNLFAIEGTSKLDVSEKPKPKQKVETPLPERGVRAAARQVGAAAETAYSVAEGAVVWPISKAAGLTGILEGGEEMKRREEATAEFLTHKPIMKETEAAMEKVGKGFEFIETPQRMASDELERKGHHRAAYLTKLFSDLFMFKAIHAGGVKAKARIIRRSIPKDVKVSQTDINRIARTVPTEKQAAQARAAKTKEGLKTRRAERGRAEHFKKPMKSAEESAAVFKREGGYPESEAQGVRLKRHLTAEGDIGRLHELKSYPGKAINLIRTELKEQKVEGEFRQPGVMVPRIQKGKEFGAKLTEGERGRLLAGETLEKPKTILRKGEPKYTTPKATGEPEVSYRIKEKGKPAVSFKKGEAEPWEPQKPAKPAVSQEDMAGALARNKAELELKPAKPSPGSVFIKNKQYPFREYRELARGKNEGKVEIILPDGKKKVVEKADVAKWPGRTEGTTLETLGFQTIYETMAKTVATRKAKEKTPRGKPIDVKDFTIGKVVKQRTWKHGRTKQQLTAPPIWELEKKIVKDMPNLREKPLGGWFENPIRTFGELGSDAKELFYRPMKEAEHRIAVERKATDTWANSLFKGSSAKSRRRIGAYAIAQQKRGEAILKKMGVRETPKLTPAETKIYKDLRQKLEQYYTQLNEARQLSGKETFGKVDNYFTFLRDLSTLEEMGFNPITTKGLMIQKQFQHLKTTPFRFERARAKMGAMPVELDAIKIFKTYSEMAVRHIHKSPAIAKGRELMLQFPEGKGHWVLKEEKPRTAKFLADWLDFQAGQRPVTNIPKVVEKALFKLNQNLAFSILSANLRSAIIQPSALVQTFAELGPKWTAVGIKSLLSLGKRNFAFERSNVLLSREYDVAVTDAIRGIKSGRVGDIKKIVGRIGFKPLQLLDIETARATWQGAYEKALKELNYTNKKAVNYADDVVTRTQASAMPSDISPIQRTALGKFVTTFQTFVINEWGFLTKDVLGIKNANINNKHTISRLSRLIVGTTLFNMLYEDVLGINSPFSTPVRAFMEAIEEGETLPSASLKVALELAEKVPVVGGGARYGSHPLGAGVELLGQTALEVSGKKKPKLETAGKWLGVPGSTQIAKTARAKKRGETPYGQVLGVYTKNKGKRLKSLKGLKNLKGLD